MKRIAASALWLVLIARADAAVTKIEILKVEPKPLPAGPTGPSAGPYEHIFGLIHGELDPNDPKNSLITDISCAAQRARQVEYGAQFSTREADDMTKSTGILRYSSSSWRRRRGGEP